MCFLPSQNLEGEDRPLNSITFQIPAREQSEELWQGCQHVQGFVCFSCSIRYTETRYSFLYVVTCTFDSLTEHSEILSHYVSKCYCDSLQYQPCI